MTAVFAQMRRDAIGARTLRKNCSAHRIGIVAAARIAHRGNVIDVDAQAQFAHAISFTRGPGCPA